MYDEIIVGSRVPSVKLGCLQGGEITAITTDELFADKKSIVLGIPGAFTPICAQQHIPDFIANAEKMRAAGYNQLICIAPNDPFVLEAWAASIDPLSKIKFMSDGNLEFCTALNMAVVHNALFLGRRSQRYLLVLHNHVVQHVKVESSILNYSCTRAQDALEL